MTDEPRAARAVSLADLAATAAFGARLAAMLRPGDTVGLSGALGAGKTTLARAVIAALTGIREDAPSPTYSLVQTYEAEHFELWHADLYRLEAPGESVELGLDDAFGEAVVLIEWPDRIADRLPEDRLDIHLAADPDAPERRNVALIGRGSWISRVDHL